MKTDKDGLHGRGRGLEEDYFRKVDRERIERLRAKEEREAARQKLSREAGIDDETSDVLLDVGIGAEELPALSQSSDLFHSKNHTIAIARDRGSRSAVPQSGLRSRGSAARLEADPAPDAPRARRAAGRVRDDPLRCRRSSLR